MTELEKQAREILAHLYESKGYPNFAREIREAKPGAQWFMIQGAMTALTAAPAGWKLVPVEPTTDMLDETAKALIGAYDCNRVWEAWSHNTMRAGDFSPVYEDPGCVYEIAMAAIAAAPPYKQDNENDPS